MGKRFRATNVGRVTLRESMGAWRRRGRRVKSRPAHGDAETRCDQNERGIFRTCWPTCDRIRLVDIGAT